MKNPFKWLQQKLPQPPPKSEKFVFPEIDVFRGKISRVHVIRSGESSIVVRFGIDEVHRLADLRPGRMVTMVLHKEQSNAQAINGGASDLRRDGGGGDRPASVPVPRASTDDSGAKGGNADGELHSPDRGPA